MMYRQMQVDQSFVNFQKILWRSSPEDEIQIYELKTITYGLSNAPYLAVKCLQHLAELEYDEFKYASNVIRNDFYMDDVLTGAQSTDELLMLKSNLIELLKKGQLELHKWCSNLSTTMNTETNQFTFHKQLQDNEDITKTLGMNWNGVEDYFIFPKPNYGMDTKLTKRMLLSEIAKQFDPLGLLEPITFTSKYLMQQIWKGGLKWDDEIPESLSKVWSDFKIELQQLDTFKISRYFDCDPDKAHIIGFCDASERGYGACLYITEINNELNKPPILICSKSRVAPIKKITLPKLELSGALLLAHLYKVVIKALKIEPLKTTLCSDSTITLSWIKSQSNKNIYLSNRITEIQEITNPQWWYHIRSKENPADILSRGTLPRALILDKLWWHGPQFLQLNESKWNIRNIDNINKEQCKEAFIMSNIVENGNELENDFSLLYKYSSFKKLTNIVAFIK